MKTYVFVLNSIFASNAAWDYVGTLLTDYCIIPRRLSDSYAVTSVNYKNTKGLHDVEGMPEIDAETYFPDTLYAGDIRNSPAFEAASDLLPNELAVDTRQNIGARSVPALSTYLVFDEYDFNYSGTFTDDAFYALENPQQVTYQLQPINNESVRFITGEYQSTPTAYTPEMLLKWTTPGTDAKITDEGREAFENAFRTFWIIGLSEDWGVTLTWYKVNKDSPATFEQQSWVYDDTVAPYGQYQLHLIGMPDSWAMANFLINNLGE
jgi:hypothetical protein